MSENLSDWASFVAFQPASAASADAIVDFVYEHFVAHEPLSQSVDVCPPGYRMPFFDKLIQMLIRHGLSTVAIDKRTGLLAGLALYRACGAEEPAEGSFGCEPPRKMADILDFLEHIVELGEPRSHYESDRMVELFILTTHSKVRYPGLGTMLALKSLDTVRALGHTLCISEATSYFSQKIFRKLGFETLASKSFEDYRPRGELIFKRQPPHGILTLVGKRLTG